MWINMSQAARRDISHGQKVGLEWIIGIIVPPSDSRERFSQLYLFPISFNVFVFFFFHLQPHPASGLNYSMPKPPNIFLQSWQLSDLAKCSLVQGRETSASWGWRMLTTKIKTNVARGDQGFHHCNMIAAWLLSWGHVRNSGRPQHSGRHNR